MRLVISTVGTSLLSNMKRHQPEGAGREDLLRNISIQGEVKASAETNALSRIIREGDQLLFLCSDTPDGNFAAKVLTQFYQQKGFKSSHRVITELNYLHDDFMSRGLKSLVNILIGEIQVARHKKLEPIISATGGFKAEIAYATLVGLVFHVPVYYIHEVFQDIICMPPAPVDWDMTLLAENEEFFEWIDKEFRRTEKVNRRLKGLPDRIQLLLEEDAEGYTTLSAAGRVYYAAYEAEIMNLPSITISDTALRFYNKLDTTQQKVIDSCVHKLRIEPLRKSGSGQIDTTDCLIYPRGDCPERIFYYENGNGISICEIAFHDMNYEDLNKKGVYKKNYENFELWKN